MSEAIEEDVLEKGLDEEACEEDFSTTEQGSGKVKALAAVAIVAVIAAVIGFVLFFTNMVPANSAAKYSGSDYVPESDVAQWIDQYRKIYGVTDDSDFASYLKQQNMTVASFRQNAIDEIVTNNVIAKRAKELGVSVTDEEVQAKLDSVSGQVTSGDSSLWASTLESMGVTEDELKTRYEKEILQDKVCAQDVAQREATDAEVLSYIQSYLADSTQKHVCTIVFSGDDKANGKPEKCYKELQALKKAGKLNAESFAALAKKYSDAEDVDETGGELGWTGSGKIGTDVSELITDMKAGSFTTPQTVEEDDGAMDIVYVDKTFKFPAASKITSVDELKIPDELLAIIKSAASSAAYQSDCGAYLAKLLADAKVTYYPVPDDASYNVSLS